MTMRGVRPVRLPRVAGDRERLQRTKRLIERDIHRLERSLAQRRSPEGQESTRAVILHKRAQVHRIHEAMYRTAPYRPIPKQKPKRRPLPQDKTPPKGSALHKNRMNKARQELNKDTAPPPMKQKVVILEEEPKVTDEKSFQKAEDVRHKNEQALHEARLAAEAEERQKKEREEQQRKKQEVPAPKPLSPAEESHLKRLSNVIPQLIQFKRTNDYRALNEEQKIDFDNKLNSLLYQAKFLSNKAQGISNANLERPKRLEPKKKSGFMQRVVQEGRQDFVRQGKQMAQQTRRRFGLKGHAHRPYAMDSQLGMITVQKHRQAQRLNRPAVESNNMKGLRRYAAAQYARDQRERAKQEEHKEVANLAGAFTRTRAVMERMVR